jgi:non-ribosomal peptide synthetase component F
VTIGATDSYQMLVEWNDTAADLGADLCLHELVEQQVRRSPDATAVGAADERLTYSELDGRAAALARRLWAVGVGPEDLVGVAIERSSALAVALFGVLKAGAAYPPVSLTHPVERIRYVLADARPSVVLMVGEHDGVPAELAMDVGGPDVDAARPCRSQPLSTAYVIYTSRSTGRPKGAAIPHRAIVNRLRWMQAEYRLGTDDRVLQKTPSDFDVSVWEFALGARTALWMVAVGFVLGLIPVFSPVRRHRNFPADERPV